jgi:hypothetical protein
MAMFCNPLTCYNIPLKTLSNSAGRIEITVQSNPLAEICFNKFSTDREGKSLLFAFY